MANSLSSLTAGVGGVQISSVDTSGSLDIKSGTTTIVSITSAGAAVTGTLSASGATTFPAGSAAAPAITTTGDTNTGMFFPAADTIAFAEGGAEAMRIDSNGNLGLGVTPSAWSNSSNLQLAGNIALAANQGYRFNNYYNLGDKSIAAGYVATAYFDTTAGSFAWQSSNSSAAGAGSAVTLVAKMTLDANGDLGLGTTDPTQKLEIRKDTTTAGSEGNILIQNYTSGTTPYYIGGIFGAAYRDVRFPAYCAGIDFYRTSSAGGLASSGEIRFYTDGNGGTQAELRTAERMRIDSNGQVMIGTTTLGYSNSNSTTIESSYIVKNHINGTASGTLYIAFGYNGTPVGTITQNGTTAVAYNTSSDYRLKENIAPMTGALATVAKLKPVTYNWKVDGSNGQGFIAHELQEVVPDCVTGEKDAVNEDGSIKPQGIDTSFLVATLTAAIQELKAIVDTQAEQIKALQGVK